MKTNDFLEQLDKENFCIVNNTGYGHISGYPLMIWPTYGAENAKKFNVLITLPATLRTEAAKDIRRKTKNAGVKIHFVKNIVSFICVRKRNEGFGAIYGQINAVISALLENGAFPPNTCYICGQGGADTYILNCENHFYDLAHSTCAEKKQAELADKALDNPGNYFTGMAGAFLGAIAGMIPALLGILLLRMISAWLFMLIPIATYYGYKLFKGRMDIAAPICAVLFSFIGFVSMLMIWDISVSIASGYTFAQAAEYMFYNTFKHFSFEYWSWLSSDFIKLIIFYVLGLIISLGTIHKTNSTEAKQIDESFKTKLPVIKNAAAQNTFSESGIRLDQ